MLNPNSGPDYTHVDKYGLPLNAFGDDIWSEFFEVLGRIVAVNGKIEYYKDRLNHLPLGETKSVTKVNQFLKRLDARADRNAIVHSWWVFGAQTDDADVVHGIRYRTGKRLTGKNPTVSIRDVPGSELEQIIARYSLDELKKILRHDIATMQIGEHAYTAVFLQS